jgi:excisionase family DNA binding protein
MVVAPVPRLLLTKEEAAAALGMSVDSFERYVMPQLRAVRKGRLRLFPIAELERWVAENLARSPAEG